MSTCSELLYLLEDFGEFEFDEEEYIRSCFDDKGEDQPDKVRTKDSVVKRNGNVEKSVRKPIVYTKQIIPPGDVRRTYPKAFESAWNNYDRSQLHDLFHGFGTKDLLTIVAYPHGNPHGPSYREIHGPQATTEYYYAYLCSVPDSLFFIHETKFIIKQGGNISIVCKFTLTGSRLYLINMTGGSEGGSDTSPTSLRSSSLDGQQKATLSSISQDSCDSAYIRSLSTMSTDSQQPPPLDLDEHLDAYNAFKQHIVFKDAYSVKNKHDKYRRMNHSTMGEYIDYSRLQGDEGSIEADGKQYAAEVKPQLQAIKTEGTVLLPSKKRVLSSDSSAVSSSVCNANTAGAAPSKDTLKRLYSGRASAADSVTSSDILVSHSNARFGLSTILPSAVRSNMCGVLRFHVDADKKVYKLELMCAFEQGGDDHA